MEVVVEVLVVVLRSVVERSRYYKGKRSQQTKQSLTSAKYRNKATLA